jgi:hypothetical protein
VGDRPLDAIDTALERLASGRRAAAADRELRVMLRWNLRRAVRRAFEARFPWLA